MTVTVDFFLSRCEREFTTTEIILTAADKFHAEGLRRCCNEAMRWWRDSDSGIYRRKRMQFVSNAGKTNFLGTECWYSHTVNAVDTGRFVG